MAMTTIAHLIGYNGHVVMINDVYGGTNRFFSKVAPNYGLKLTLVNMTEPNELQAVVTESTKVKLDLTACFENCS
jgi:cystathionine gamma-lyase